MTTETTLRIYVASLSDYNAGTLHGKWIDVTDADTMREEIAAMLAESPTAKTEGSEAEEWAVHDYEGFGPLKLSETEDLDELADIAEAVEEHDGAFLAWAANDDGNRDARSFQEEFSGEWDSLADYVEQHWKDSGDMPKAPANSWWHPANYIDWDRMAHDLELSGDIWTAETPTGGVWVFSNR